MNRHVAHDALGAFLVLALAWRMCRVRCWLTFARQLQRTNLRRRPRFDGGSSPPRSCSWTLCRRPSGRSSSGLGPSLALVVAEKRGAVSANAPIHYTHTHTQVQTSAPRTCGDDILCFLRHVDALVLVLILVQAVVAVLLALLLREGFSKVLGREGVEKSVSQT